VNLPPAVREAVESAIEDRTGRSVGITRVTPVGGGCISPTARIETADGAPFFLKWGSSELPAGMLAAEAVGLRALASAETLRVPEVLGAGGDGAAAWLLMEWLPPGRPTAGTWSRLGRGLAGIHRRRSNRFGAEADNYIGPLPQSNRESDDWAEFWRNRRLEPQVAMAMDSGLLGASDGRRFDALFGRLEALLAPASEDGPSLLHGDLWNGNVHVMESGEPAVIDPSAYHGHREVDLAMAELFGGFDRGFHHAYNEAWPLAPGYAPGRRAAYQLYYLLVHVNLFGASYVAGTRNALAAAGV